MVIYIYYYCKLSRICHLSRLKESIIIPMATYMKALVCAHVFFSYFAFSFFCMRACFDLTVTVAILKAKGSLKHHSREGKICGVVRRLRPDHCSHIIFISTAFIRFGTSTVTASLQVQTFLFAPIL